MCARGRVSQHGKSCGVDGDVQQGAGDSLTWRRGMADGSVVPLKPGNAGGGKGPWFKTDAGSGEGRRLGNLTTPEGVGKLQAALHAKAKAEPGFRFYVLYDKMYREDVLAHAYDRCRANKGAPGVDGQTFADVEAYGRERWLGELAETLRKETYEPQPIRRVYIPKPGGKLRPLGVVARIVSPLIFRGDLRSGADDLPDWVTG